ncbi:osmoprotectant transport system substrate-binding protein [Halopolyspora algeriensis]|uniref:Osmoprotectant transport system substrate-binding protein n=1 Tax=Halopolyspora algeriensis TaxID=1500506 RepID=A0A368VTM6_9ACTN|nr:ABC transporter substrate-binding protein [Halopolyspora algeriensis]RCW45340.1 osmoprotectant transport system substrate-binding protein [Halopolyspora algeriensis]TQM47380.1 osmoprotectant transport system substrate-binding protein [Halopolyspora algeriensis]
MRRVFALGLALVATLTLTGCGSGDPLESGSGSQGPIVVGSADFAESELLMEIYAEALRSTGAEVRTKGRIGAREVYVKAVRQGELSVIPDYTGNLLKYVNEKAQATKSQPVYDALKQSLPPQLGVLQYSPAEDSDVLTVTAETAASGLRSMADLGPRCGELVLGAPAEWKVRWKDRIAEVYGCTFSEIRELQAGSVTVDALLGGEVQVANLFSTSAAIDRNNLVKLADPKNMFPAQNVVPLVHRGDLNRQQTDALNRVSQALTTTKLAELNKRLMVDKANPADLAKTFVTGVGV